MSRLIQSANNSFVNTMKTTLEQGKLVITDYHGQTCALYIAKNRLIEAFFPGFSNIGAIYIGKVKNVAKNINAYFVEIAKDTNVFLPFDEAKCPFILNREYDGRLIAGDEVIVRITKDAQKNKQATATAHLEFATPYFVLTFGNPNIGYSSKFTTEQKQFIEDVLQNNNIATGKLFNQERLKSNALQTVPSTGLIVRTEAANLSTEALNNQFLLCRDMFLTFLSQNSHKSCYTKLNDDSNALEDIIVTKLAGESYTEIVTDSHEIFHQLQQMKENGFIQKEISLYQDSYPLSKLYSIETKLTMAVEQRIWLKSGGYIVLQHTEALTVIDVNSGKFEAKTQDETQTYLKVNLEACEEIAYQLRLRNISGIIIVDFINLKQPENAKALLNALKTYVSTDKVPTKVVDMTPLGLVEITRAKQSAPLKEQMYQLGLLGGKNETD